jgi:transcription antitermination factor NusG
VRAIEGGNAVIDRTVSRGTDSASVDELFPSNLLVSPSSSCSEDDDSARRADWWLAHTLPRQEKAVAMALRGQNAGYYLPLVNRKSLTRGRTRLARIPLFPGYVFICGDQETRLGALKTNRLLTVQPVPDGEALRLQLLRFANLIAMGAPLVRESRIAAGERVRIKAGPLRGTEGVVLRRNGKAKLLIAIDFLQQGASFEIDDCMLEPVD